MKSLGYHIPWKHLMIIKKSTGWDHTRNLHIKRPIVLIFLPSLLEIQIVYEALRFPWIRPDATKFNLDNFNDCIKLNFH